MTRDVVVVLWKTLIFVDIMGWMWEGINTEEEEMVRAVAVKNCNAFTDKLVIATL